MFRVKIKTVDVKISEWGIFIFKLRTYPFASTCCRSPTTPVSLRSAKSIICRNIFHSVDIYNRTYMYIYTAWHFYRETSIIFGRDSRQIRLINRLTINDYRPFSRFHADRKRTLFKEYWTSNLWDCVKSKWQMAKNALLVGVHRKPDHYSPRACTCQ